MTSLLIVLTSKFPQWLCSRFIPGGRLFVLLFVASYMPCIAVLAATIAALIFGAINLDCFFVVLAFAIINFFFGKSDALLGHALFFTIRKRSERGDELMSSDLSDFAHGILAFRPDLLLRFERVEGCEDKLRFCMMSGNAIVAIVLNVYCVEHFLSHLQLRPGTTYEGDIRRVQYVQMENKPQEDGASPEIIICFLASSEEE